MRILYEVVILIKEMWYIVIMQPDNFLKEYNKVI